MLRKTRGTVPFAGNVVAIWKPWKRFVKRKVAGGLTESGNGNGSQKQEHTWETDASSQEYFGWKLKKTVLLGLMLFFLTYDKHGKINAL